MSSSNNSSSDSSDSNDSSDSSEFEEEVTELLVAHLGSQHYLKHMMKEPYRNDAFTGREFVYNVLNGHRDRCLDLFRLRTNVLYDLSDALKSRGLLRDTRFVKVEEQLCIFLYTIGHNERNRVVADRFQHSQETISRHFAIVLKAICRFAREIILPPDFETTHPYIKSKGDKYWPWFKNCVGAIDGTHISASVPSGRTQIPYRGRKTSPTQNVMCACDFDMCFTYVLAGWEGTANDSRVFMETITDPRQEFPMPPEGKFYLVDSGYANIPGFLAPYRGQRYHASEYIGTNPIPPRTAREQFNFAHSSLRMVIERCFGVLKRRFPILDKMPSYSLRKQRNIVIAACTIHNFIRKHALEDAMFTEFQDKDMTPEGNHCDHGQSSTNVRMVRGANNLRDEICRDMLAHYRLPL